MMCMKFPVFLWMEISTFGNRAAVGEFYKSGFFHIAVLGGCTEIPDRFQTAGACIVDPGPNDNQSCPY
ncbi:hypothetical protein L902_00530 [Agrobacterium radiobacter DSM 30147]|nr:hypothetical protein L902_00530 [Agrobacterium radiobacter DSM 30147]